MVTQDTTWKVVYRKDTGELLDAINGFKLRLPGFGSKEKAEAFIKRENFRITIIKVI